MSEAEKATNTTLHPEVLRLRDVLGTIKNIYRLNGELQVDDLKSEVYEEKHAKLHGLYQRLDVDPSKIQKYDQLHEIEYSLTSRAINPRPIVDIPEAHFFTSRIKTIIENPEIRIMPTEAAIGKVSLKEVTVYGYTDWEKVKSRDQRSIGEYIHTIASVMGDPVSYHLNFASADFGGSYANDHIAIEADYRIYNGRHRSLATCALGEDCVTEANMNQWIEVFADNNFMIPNPLNTNLQ